jgi:apolipoprotein D and lipocalin family protein
MEGTRSKLTSRDIFLDNAYSTMTISGDDKIKLFCFTDARKICDEGHALIRVIHLINENLPVSLDINKEIIDTGIKYLSEKSHLLKLGRVSNTISIISDLIGDTIFGPLSITPGNKTIHTLFMMGKMTSIKGILVNDNGPLHDLLDECFNIDEYMGKWILHAGMPQLFAENIDFDSQTVNYTLLSDEIKVYNRYYKQGKLVDSIIGSAKVVNPMYPQAFNISYQGVSNNFNINYVIHRFKKCSYAIVGSPDRSSYYLLSKEDTIPCHVYKRFIKMGKSLGYDVNKIKIYVENIL